MAKKIEWTQTSIQDRLRIYHFWIDHNKSNTYSQKLEILFNEAAKLISEFPEVGTETDYPELRVKVVKSYKIFYINNVDKIQIVRVWDSRQNPSDLQLP
ncbi:MAG: type II toxin-antitoxin system RelE/ParE family toxin, partial [Bacteroidetes bacterium]|nr:type II toxin-antitoxin system RelE/ParE family toxin [Bacteroidota bacterium]